jgi:hypothetical protein
MSLCFHSGPFIQKLGIPYASAITSPCKLPERMYSQDAISLTTCSASSLRTSISFNLGFSFNMPVNFLVHCALCGTTPISNFLSTRPYTRSTKRPGSPCGRPSWPESNSDIGPRTRVIRTWGLLLNCPIISDGAIIPVPQNVLRGPARRRIDPSMICIRLPIATSSASSCELCFTLRPLIHSTTRGLIPSPKFGAPFHQYNLIGFVFINNPIQEIENRFSLITQSEGI